MICLHNVLSYSPVSQWEKADRHLVGTFWELLEYTAISKQLLISIDNGDILIESLKSK